MRVLPSGVMARPPTRAQTARDSRVTSSRTVLRLEREAGNHGATVQGLWTAMERESERGRGPFASGRGAIRKPMLRSDTHREHGGVTETRRLCTRPS